MVKKIQGDSFLRGRCVFSLSAETCGGGRKGEWKKRYINFATIWSILLLCARFCVWQGDWWCGFDVAACAAVVLAVGMGAKIRYWSFTLHFLINVPFIFFNIMYFNLYGLYFDAYHGFILPYAASATMLIDGQNMYHCSFPVAWFDPAKVPLSLWFIKEGSRCCQIYIFFCLWNGQFFGKSYKLFFWSFTKCGFVRLS